MPRLRLCRFVLGWLGVVALTATTGRCADTPASGPVVRWTMLGVTPKQDVADSHLIQTPSGATLLMDAGLLGDSPGAVVNRLEEAGVSLLDLVVISHFHIDHYGALLGIHDAGIVIRRVAVNVPDPAAANPEMPWGCNLDHVRYTLDELTKRGIPWFTPVIGERIWEEVAAPNIPVTLDVICVYDGLNTPVGRTDVNDTSIIARLSIGDTRALFTGDLNHSLGTYLAGSDFDLRADLIKVPHHGVESAAPNAFFDCVQARAALVPVPRHHWLSDRASRIRSYFEERAVPTYVSGIHGNVTVVMHPAGFSITTEH